jgi:hypothetical protein
LRLPRVAGQMVNGEEKYVVSSKQGRAPLPA